MRSWAERLASLPREERASLLACLSEHECEELLYAWREVWARPNQIAPDGEWDIWLIMAGRGFGKTRSGAEWIRERVRAGARRIALIAETQKDLEEVMIEGESGLLSVFPVGERPEYRKRPVRLVFSTGALALGYNATQPDQLRGPQFDTAWCDELAKWRYARETWDQLQFGLRIGSKPRQVITTTPRPIDLLSSIIAGKEGVVHITRGRTLDNRSHLSPGFLEKIEKRYAATILGLQELEGVLITDLPGSLWSFEKIEAARVLSVPGSLSRILVAVDPAVSQSGSASEHGLIVAGVCAHKAYVLEDASLRGSPLDWAHRAVAVHDHYGADGIVVEINQGGAMVSQTLRSVCQGLNIIEVRATRGKHVRAEPIAALYEQGRIHHVGLFPELEKQMTLMTSAGFVGEGSPDRLDALVWVMTELFPDIIETRDIKIPNWRVRPVV